MQKKVEIIRFARNNMIKLLDGLSIEELNIIPFGFNNNMLWHLGHVIAVQQSICYVRSGNKPLVNDALIHKYKNGTWPEVFIDEKEKASLVTASEVTLDRFDKDIQEGLFDSFEPFALANGMQIASIDDAATMLSFHEGLHMGYVQALKRAISL